MTDKTEETSKPTTRRRTKAQAAKATDTKDHKQPETGGQTRVSGLVIIHH